MCSSDLGESFAGRVEPCQRLHRRSQSLRPRVGMVVRSTGKPRGDFPQSPAMLDERVASRRDPGHRHNVQPNSRHVPQDGVDVGQTLGRRVLGRPAAQTEPSCRRRQSPQAGSAESRTRRNVVDLRGLQLSGIGGQNRSDIMPCVHARQPVLLGGHLTGGPSPVQYKAQLDSSRRVSRGHAGRFRQCPPGRLSRFRRLSA